MAPHPEEALSFEEHLAFWCLAESFELPAEEQLISDARLIVETNFALDQELQGKGVGVCPIWEDGGARTGAYVRGAALPEPFFNTYFSEAEAKLRDPRLHRLLAHLLPHLFEDISVATAALDDTLRLWLDADAPTYKLGLPYQGHYMLLSALLLDFARKAAGGLSLQEWLASLGMTESFFDPQPVPSFEALHDSMQKKLEQLWDLEDAWLAESL